MKMKANNRSIIFLSGFLIVSLLGVALAANNLGNSKASLIVQTDKNVVLLGEVVNINFEFQNNGNDSVQILSNEGLGQNTELLIARRGEQFRKYFRSDWGRVDGEAKVISLLPNQTYQLNSKDATILWNGKPDYSHLNPDAAKKADESDNRVLTDYVFPEVGVYLVKSTSCLLDNLKKCSIYVESNVIEITVKEPTGDDLEVWNQIKGNREIALLMQRGEFQTENSDEKTKLVSEVEQIIERYPNSIYSNYLKPNLAKFRASEAKRQEFLQKLQNQKEKP
jgi:hypothetical protein